MSYKTFLETQCNLVRVLTKKGLYPRIVGYNKNKLNDSFFYKQRKQNAVNMMLTLDLGITGKDVWGEGRYPVTEQFYCTVSINKAKRMVKELTKVIKRIEKKVIR